MSEWVEFKLAEIMDILGGGTPKSSIPEYWDGTIPWLSVTDFNTGQKYVYEAEKKITELGLEKSSTKILKKDKIIISERGTVGVIAMLGNDMAFNQSCYGIDAKEKFTKNNYLYYLLKNTVPKLLSASYGAVFDTITKNTFNDIKVKLPPLPEQKAIAEILSSLDEKIDLLHRQNKTLEAMAETLFRQWFIEEADEGWEEKPLSYFGDIVCGKTPSTKRKEYFNGEIPFIKIPDMHGITFIFSTLDTLTEEGKKSQTNKTLPKRSICISCIATVGLVSITTQDSQTNQQINTIIPYKDEYLYYLYLFMKLSYSLLQSMGSGGTATLNLNTGNFSKIEIGNPKNNKLKEFHNIIEPIFDKIYINQKNVLKIENLRDIILPKLMSGEVRVKE
jgi:type I restriction enzyme, S subunit